MAEKRRGVITRKRIKITRTDHLSLEHYPGADAGCDQLQGTHIGCDAVWLPHCRSLAPRQARHSSMTIRSQLKNQQRAFFLTDS